MCFPTTDAMLSFAVVDPQEVPRLLLLLGVVLTHLGNPLLAVGTAATVYWLDPRATPQLTISRRQAASLLAVVLCG